MKLAMVSRPLAEADLRLAQQLGMTDVVTTMTGMPMTPERIQGPAWRYLDLLHLRQQVEDAGLTLSVIEGYQHDAQAAPLIERYLRLTERLTSKPRDLFCRNALMLLPYMQALSPAYVTEIRGLAGRMASQLGGQSGHRPLTHRTVGGCLGLWFLLRRLFQRSHQALVDGGVCDSG